MAIDWDAVDRALGYYHTNNCGPLLYDWMLDNWGIRTGDDFIEIVDEKKYAMFVLRFA